MARALALNNAEKVYIIGRRKEVLEQAAKSVDTDNIIPIVCDVTSREALAAAVARVTEETGYINLFIANSGIGGPQAKLAQPLPAGSALKDFIKSYGDYDASENAKTFELNVTAVWFSIMNFLPLLDKGNERGNVGQRSQVLTTSSIAGFNRMAPGGFVYGQSKAATTHLMKQLASNLAPYKIRCNVIAPGREYPLHTFPLCVPQYAPNLLSTSFFDSTVRTSDNLCIVFPSEMAAPIIGDGVFPIEKIPLQRPGTEEEMAGATLFLASQAGGYCNGCVLLIDGGRLSMMPSTY